MGRGGLRDRQGSCHGQCRVLGVPKLWGRQGAKGEEATWEHSPGRHEGRRVSEEAPGRQGLRAGADWDSRG